MSAWKSHVHRNRPTYAIYDALAGESIPIRLFLSPYELTPTYRNINNKFSVKYFLNLVLVDEEDRRYFKQQEITVYRLLENSWFFVTSWEYSTWETGAACWRCHLKHLFAFLTDFSLAFMENFLWYLHGVCQMTYYLFFYYFIILVLVKPLKWQIINRLDFLTFDFDFVKIFVSIWFIVISFILTSWRIVWLVNSIRFSNFLFTQNYCVGTSACPSDSCGWLQYFAEWPWWSQITYLTKEL